MKTVPFEPLLAQVLKPARYINHEIHSFQKKPSLDTINFCFAFPDVYEVGFSHNGLKLLYQIINQENNSMADRVYAPWPDFAQELQQHDFPLFGIESKMSLADFDVVGFTLQSELTFTNILYMLDLAKIPLWAKERDEDAPLIIAGGPCATNPESVAPFFDMIFIGEAEEAILEIKEILKENKSKKRQEKLLALAKIKGAYVPEIHTAETSRISIRKFTSFAQDSAIDNWQLLPWIQPTHDRYVAEIMRGCSHGCRFCHAGFFYRPVREKSKEDIKRKILEEVAHSGWKEVALLSLSSSDYSCIHELLTELYCELNDSKSHISLPSLRVDSLSEAIIELINKMNQTGLTIAPEAGSQRLRNVINKTITENDILHGVNIALENGWQLIKLYFMIGLPTETQQDIEEIVSLIEKIIALSKKKLQLNITISPFVPKPFTPFQWAEMDAREHLMEKIHYLKNALRKHKFVKIKYHELDYQLIEGLIGRGDRQISDWIYHAYRNGAKFDGWSEHFDFQYWKKAAEQIDLRFEDYTGELEIETTLPWDHIDIGIDKGFLQKEWNNAKQEVITPDCREKCSHCGLCDNDIFPEYASNEFKNEIKSVTKNDVSSADKKTFYRVFFAKMGEMRFVGHLDLLRTLQRMLRASGLPLFYSSGFHPKPFLSICPPLSLGLEGENEYFDFALQQDISFTDVKKKLEIVFPKALTFHKVMYSNEKKMRAMEYYPKEEIWIFPDEKVSFFKEKVGQYQESEIWTMKRIRKGKEKEVDVKKVIDKMMWQEDSLILVKKRVGATVFDILESVFEMNREQAGELRIVRKRFREA